DPEQFYKFSSFGAYYSKNTHLKKGLGSDPYHFTYSYTFDSDGKITSVISKYGQASDTMVYKYSCP
ncbi:MAG: hypothetical protein M3139_04345, partial [Bacteroidota bacterium]|nr:hypothetical protein [Bacteroidota bacterium]